jgi:hypothetical protein
MESTSPTEDPPISLPADEHAGEHDAPPAPGEAHTRELQAKVGTAARDECPVCGAPLAADQRYCVECGQRLAQARAPFMGAQLERASGAAAAPPKRSRFGMTPNSTLIAAIGTLLLAMGVGVLIGRSGQSSNAKRSPVTRIVVPSTSATGAGGSAAAGSTPAGGSSQSSGKAASQAPTSSSGNATPAKGAAPKPTQATSKPANPTVKLGQKGSGKGYQHGKFTGHFFGGENEEDAGEEGSAESKSSSKK